VAGLTLGAALLLLSIFVAASPLSRIEAPAAGSPSPARAPAGGRAPSGIGNSPAQTPRTRYRIAGCVSHGEGAVRGGPRRKEVAIGFDDGPWTNTPGFVTMLERAGVRATFFLIGRQVTASCATGTSSATTPGAIPT
jgi:hypothetical protein